MLPKVTIISDNLRIERIYKESSPDSALPHDSFCLIIVFYDKISEQISSDQKDSAYWFSH